MKSKPVDQEPKIRPTLERILAEQIKNKNISLWSSKEDIIVQLCEVLNQEALPPSESQSKICVCDVAVA